ncbi:STAS domain-containing protein [Jatrophihabitans telluris]|uniref:Anti-sigma factor antagonist n=1 Tax=Jatrophihabitans telluris TaxID=2038343 RepID=A0ABY4QZY2_9ACTN|nr:STAS domain-containing protein [Jatrophihabitans telluris]UQX89039.1 STAS domain-containing protein [Jatrophihabitans telluris]
MSSERAADDETGWLILQGDLDIASAHAPVELGHRLFGERTPRRVMVDLTAVSFIDSSGLGGLVQLSNLVAARGAALFLTGANPRIVTLLHLSGLAAVLPLADPATPAASGTVPEAIG